MNNNRYRTSTQRRRTDYHICPRCGAALDSGERCECEHENISIFAPRIDFKEQKGINVCLG